ncbi:MAG TPA: hypothetical protein VNQ76_13850 [Planctomicrobium sp.]|nr:hypothetical protein [Planctomicrobium sp.]
MTDAEEQPVGDDEALSDSPTESTSGRRTVEVNGQRYSCEPKREGGFYDPTSGGTQIIDGVEYWCVPYHIAFPGRRYDQGGRKDPADTD